MANIGIMEGAYFVGRGELLSWINALLGFNYTKIEQTASGAAHCLVLNTIYPGKVPLSKVNLNAKFDYEFIKNLKVLQECFLKLGIDKVVDINRLSKAKYQDNLEFTQWMKRYWDLHYPGDVTQFTAVNPTPAATPRAAVAATPASPKKPASPRAAPPVKRNSTTGLSGAPARAAPAPAPAPARKENTAPTPSPAQTVNHGVSPVSSNAPAATDMNATKQREQTLLIAELRLTAEGLEKERDFYFKKLREIETLCESADEASQPFIKKIQAVLYAADDIPTTDA